MIYRIIISLLLVIALGTIAVAKGFIGNNAPSFSSGSNQTSVPSDSQPAAPANNGNDVFKNLKM